MKERKKPEKFLLPHGRPSDDRSFAFSSRVLSKAAKIKALINYGIISTGGQHDGDTHDEKRSTHAGSGRQQAAQHRPSCAGITVMDNRWSAERGWVLYRGR